MQSSSSREADAAAKPRCSYTIWFSQRTGSTLLTTALEATGIAGRPHEWFERPAGVDFLAHYGVSSIMAFREMLWQRGSTPNGVYGAKVSWYEPRMSDLFHILRQIPGVVDGASRPSVWAHAFPNHHHIFMTRRNKVRLAVSWWRAIRSQAWHRVAGTEVAQPPEDAYDFDAINHLFAEAAMREAGIQAFFSEAAIVPLTIVYEDFIASYEDTVRRILDYLGLDADRVAVPPPAFEQISDDIADAWVARFRQERQEDWVNRGW